MHGELDSIESYAARGEIAELLERLSHQDWQVRRAALEAVVDHAVERPDAGAAIIDTLLTAIGSEDDAGRRNAAQEALVRLAPMAVDRIVARLADAAVDVKILLAPVLGESHDAAAAPALAELAQSNDLNVAAAAVAGLGRLRRREAAAPLLGILSHGNAWLVFPAAEALGVLGDDRAVGHLSSRLDDLLVRSTALEALARIASPRAAEALAARAFSTRPIDSTALAALCKINHAESPSELAHGVHDMVVGSFRKFYSEARFAELADLTSDAPAGANIALEVLGWTGDTRALPILVAALAGPASVSAATAGLLELASDPAIGQELGRLGLQLDGITRVDVAAVLAQTSPVDAAMILADVLVSDDDMALDAVDLMLDAAEAVRSDVAIDEIAAVSAIERLLDSIGAVSPEAARAIVRLVRALARVPHVEPGAIADRAPRLLESEDPYLRLAGAELLVALGRSDDSLISFLEGAMESGGEVGIRALEVIATLDSPRMVDLLESALGSDDPRIRRAAVAALGASAGTKATDLLRIAAEDANAMVGALALTSYAGRVGAHAEGLLAAASRDERPLLRCAAAECLVETSDGSALDIVMKLAVSDPEAEVRRSALGALVSRADTAEALTAVSRGLADENPGARCAALRLAAAVGDRSAVQRIVEIGSSDRTPDVRGEALTTLATLAPAEALRLLGRYALDHPSSSYTVRAVERLWRADGEALGAYRENDAPPRVAATIHKILGERVR